MLRKKLWRTMRLYKAQFISMVIMIALAVGIFVGFNMEWVSIHENTEAFFEETGYADYRIISEKGFTKQQREDVEDISGVDASAGYMTATVDVKEQEGDSLSLSVTEHGNVSGMLAESGKEYDEKSEDGIWLSKKYAQVNDVKIGDSLTLCYKNVEFQGVVKGLIYAGEHMICVRDESQLMPDYETHGFAYISPVLYEKTIGAAFYPQIHVISGMEKKEFVEAVDEVLQETSLVLTKEETVSYAEAKGEEQEGKVMGAILPVLFLVIAVLTMVTTMYRITEKEKVQIGTLKALGFRDKKILLHYTSYAAMISILGTLPGILLGYGIAALIMNPKGMMGTYMEMPYWKLRFPLVCVVVIVVMIVLMIVIGFLSVRRILQGSPAETLRPYVPKKMKSMLVEKTRLFHRLPFGTRWNMRDIVRHKARTAMTMLGIVGCMIIIVCAVGMKESMDEFLDVYYDGATNYHSCIYIAEDATEEEREALVEQYRGDWSASVSVQIEEKAVALDVYDVSNDMVRFPGVDNEYIEMGNEGAYVCMRIANQFDLQEGDTLEVSPYGSDQRYQLKVAGIIRSVSENVVISDEYARSVEIPYSITSVYTDTDKSDIAADSRIKNIQSKQAIRDSFDGFMEIMNLMIVLFVAAAIILAVIVLYNLGTMSYTERYREMATLKVLGFCDKKIAGLLIGQNMWVTCIGVIVGLPFGILTLDLMLKYMATEYEVGIALGWLTYVSSIVLTFGVSLVVSLMLSRKNRFIDMVEALKQTD